VAMQYICDNPQRKTRIRDSVTELNGIDYLEVYDPPELELNLSQLRLFVHMIKTDNLADLNALNFRIEGGSRIKNINVQTVTIAASDANVVIVDLDRFGDFSLYRLQIVKGAGDLSPPDWLDPILSSVAFSFKVACPSDFDCQQDINCPPQPLPEPEIDYLAKDYASFRQLMLDRLANIIPDWQERNPSDLGVAIVEILAYAGDQLSYYQDAVATEAYLGTARRRISMRRHTRLLDYVMHEGSNARTWVALLVSEVANNFVVPSHTPLLTRGPRPAVSEIDVALQSGFSADDSSELNNNIDSILPFALLANDSIEIKETSQITLGNVAVNLSSGTIKVEKDVQITEPQSVITADTIEIKEGAVLANIAYKNDLQNDGSITGTTSDNVSFPLLTFLPTVPEFEHGSDDIKIDAGDSITLDAGLYEKFEVGSSAHVTFSGGVYTFKEWKIKQNARLFFSSATEIRITQDLETKNQVRINQGTAQQTIVSNELIIYVGVSDNESGESDDNESEIKFGSRNKINVTLIAPSSTLEFKDKVKATGTFFAKSIVSGKQAQFQRAPIIDSVIVASQLRQCINSLDSSMLVFESLHPVTLQQQHNEIEFYTWGDNDCCLPMGSTSASLNNEKNRLANLKIGDLLLFEEVMGSNARAEDANVDHRHVIRITTIKNLDDPLYQEQQPYFVDGVEKTALRVRNIEWALEDALPFPLCLKVLLSKSNLASNGELELENDSSVTRPMSIARGNIVLADHGRSICQEALIPNIVPEFGIRYRPHLQRKDLTYRVLYDDETARAVPASSQLQQDLRRCIPDLQLQSSNSVTWQAQQDLLNSGRFSTEFVTEMEDDGSAQIRFGDSILGKRPAAGLEFLASYRIGNGTAGNIGAQSLVQIILPKQHANLELEIDLYQPFAAFGGTQAETIEQARSNAPQAFRTQKRAVTAQDYAVLAETHREVQKAVAQQRWTGSWHTVFITIDRKGGYPVDVEFERAIRDFLEPLRMMGHDIEVEAPRLVSLDISFSICVLAEYLKSKVKEELLDVFSRSELTNGERGFFHPDNFTFGQSVYLSRMISRVMQVPGVSWVDPIRFQRWGEATQDLNQQSLEMMLPIARLEIAQLDNDPNAPENGKIEFIMEGGL